MNISAAAGLQALALTAGDLPGWLLRAPQVRDDAPLVLHLHGGAFYSRRGERPPRMARLLADAGAAVVAIDYPLAPEHPFPRPLEAAYVSLQWLHQQRAAWRMPRAPLLVAGEQAGGNLAAALALMARDRGGPPLAGQILLSPLLDPAMGTASLRDACAGHGGCPLYEGWHKYLSRCTDAQHPYAAPPQSSRLAGLPPALVISAPRDPLRDEAFAYAARLRAAGVDAQECLCDAIGLDIAADCGDALCAAFERFFADHAPHPATARRRLPPRRARRLTGVRRGRSRLG